MARGQVLSGSRRVELASWPLHGNVLVQFEQSRPELDALLRPTASCGLAPYGSSTIRLTGLPGR